MTEDPEARAQLARLAGDERLLSLPAGDIDAALEARLDAVADGLLAEAAASDDVSDKETALQYLEGRLQFFAGLIGPEQQARLREALHAKMTTW